MQNASPQLKSVDDGCLAMEEGTQAQPPPSKKKNPPALQLEVVRCAQDGRKDLLEAFLDDKLADALEYKVSSPKYAGYAVLGACSGGCNEVLDWLADHRIDPKNYGGVSVRAAAGGGHVATLEWLKEHGVDVRDGGMAALSRAAENGHIGTLEWLEQEGLSLEAGGPELARSASRRLDMIKWLDHRFGREWTKKHALQATIGAAESGSLDVLDWLRKRVCIPARDQNHLYHPDVFIAAVRANQLSTLTWLEKNDCLACHNHKEGIKVATALGHNELAEWIRGRKCFVPQSCLGIWWAKLIGKTPAAKHEKDKDALDISVDDDALIEAV